MRLSGFSGLELLNIIPPWGQVLLGFTTACSCSPTVEADIPIFVQWYQAEIALQPSSSNLGAMIPNWALSEQKYSGFLISYSTCSPKQQLSEVSSGASVEKIRDFSRK